ncbi:hypothetical protein CP532_4158 [Ophiocordyceps camponoti-leonardi (nom. inval.)]|nr:hypothetical protein CP532_4158 [Ophiocordyceps camponoti-leonardi (nom. inval.)]
MASDEDHLEDHLNDLTRPYHLSDDSDRFSASFDQDTPLETIEACAMSAKACKEVCRRAEKFLLHPMLYDLLVSGFAHILCGPSDLVVSSQIGIELCYDALFEFLEDEHGRWVVQETHYIKNRIVKDGLSGPPLVKKGVIGIHKNGREIQATRSDGVIDIPAGTRHRFWAHASSQEDLVFQVWAEPQDLDHSFDENFLRNFVGYHRDCQEANIKPSIFQIILLSYNSATVATPPFWMPLWILRLFHYLLAYWIGAALLGYKASYPEYSKPTEAGGKKSI